MDGRTNGCMDAWMNGHEVLREVVWRCGGEADTRTTSSVGLEDQGVARPWQVWHTARGLPAAAGVGRTRTVLDVYMHAP